MAYQTNNTPSHQQSSATSETQPLVGTYRQRFFTNPKVRAAVAGCFPASLLAIASGAASGFFAAGIFLGGGNFALGLTLTLATSAMISVLCCSIAWSAFSAAIHCLCCPSLQASPERGVANSL